MIEMKCNYDQPTPYDPNDIFVQTSQHAAQQLFNPNFSKMVLHINYDIHNLLRLPSFCSLHIMFILHPRNRIRPIKGHKPTSYQGSSAYNKNPTRKKMNQSPYYLNN